jgi:hypothetical protein
VLGEPEFELDGQLVRMVSVANARDTVADIVAGMMGCTATATTPHAMDLCPGRRRQPSLNERVRDVEQQKR